MICGCATCTYLISLIHLASLSDYGTGKLGPSWGGGLDRSRGKICRTRGSVDMILASAADMVTARAEGASDEWMGSVVRDGRTRRSLEAASLEVDRSPKAVWMDAWQN